MPEMRLGSVDTPPQTAHMSSSHLSLIPDGIVEGTMLFWILSCVCKRGRTAPKAQYPYLQKLYWVYESSKPNYFWGRLRFQIKHNVSYYALVQCILYRLVSSFHVRCHPSVHPSSCPCNKQDLFHSIHKESSREMDLRRHRLRASHLHTFPLGRVVGVCRDQQSSR